MLCPVEKSTLRSHEEGSTQIFICETCQGFWFSREQLANFLKAGVTPNFPATKAVFTSANGSADQRHCPCCENKELIPRFVDGIEIDVCPQCCGIWLDSGELDLVIARYRESPKQRLAEMGFETVADPELLSDVAEIIGDASGATAEVASDAASALLSFIAEIFGSL